MDSDKLTEALVDAEETPEDTPTVSTEEYIQKNEPEDAEVPDENDVTETSERIDYEKIAREDLIRLKEEFPELSSLSNIAELENPLRYASLRDLGLTPAEAYLATRRRERRQDNRAHLESSIPRAAATIPGSMSDAELRAAREIFSDISDAEIKNLYKRVTQ